jgi:hypothetical protein
MLQAVPPASNVVIEDDRWKATLERVIPAIVAIRFMTVRPFDTYSAGSSSATGMLRQHCYCACCWVWWQWCEMTEE